MSGAAAPVDQCRGHEATAVRLLAAPDDEARWDAFVQERGDGTFYHLSGWRRIIGDELGHPTFYFYAERDGHIEGVLPLARVKSFLFGDALISLPFLVYGGPVASDARARELLLDRAVALAEELGVDYLELRNRARLTDWPVKNDYVTFRKALEPDPDANLKAVPRKQRAMIRKGEKAGLEACIDADARDLHRVLSECKRNLGTPFFARSYLQRIKDEFGDRSEILSVTHEGQVVSSVMSFIHGDEILPYYGGGPAVARRYHANDYMYWKVMERACRRGLRVFDYGRSQAGTGSYRFKKHWGFEPEPLAYEYHLVKAASVPKLDPSNPKYRGLIRLWSKLPLSVACTAGPPIARLLG